MYISRQGVKGPRPVRLHPSLLQHLADVLEEPLSEPHEGAEAI